MISDKWIFSKGSLRVVIIIVLVLCLINLAALLTQGAELNISGIETYESNKYVKTVDWVKNGDTVYVNVTTTASGSSGDWVYVNVSSDSDANGILLNCTYHASTYCHGNFKVSDSSSNGTGSKAINAIEGDQIYLMDKDQSTTYKTLGVDNTKPTTAFTTGGTKIEYNEKVFLNQTSTITLTGTDLGGSGVDKIVYRFQDEPWKESGTPANLVLTGRWGPAYLTYYSVDNANNTENMTTKKIVILRDWGDRTINPTTTETYVNESVLCRRLTVEGTLIFKNVTYFAQHVTPYIIVSKGGVFNITDNDGDFVSTDDASILKGEDGTAFYRFRVDKGGSLLMENSIMHDCGDATASGQRGPYILSDDVLIVNNTINGTYCAIEVENSSPNIIANTFQNNRVPTPSQGYGILVTGNRSYPNEPLKIKENTFKHGSSMGIDIQDHGVSPHSGKSLVYSSYGSNLENNLSFNYNLSDYYFPVLTFSEWSDMDETNENGTLWITDDDGATYKPLFYSPGDGIWQRRSINLKAYANKNITLVFNYTTVESPNDPGWYLDNIDLMNLPETSSYSQDMEYPCCGTPQGGDEPNPLKEWFRSDDAYNNCDWEHGTPSFGVTSAANGSYCWGTDLDDNTRNDQQSFLLLDKEYICAGGDLTFWHHYKTESANVGGNVQISIDHGGSWSVLDPGAYPTSSVSSLQMGPGFTGDSGAWVKATLSLEEYVGYDILLKFVYGDKEAGDSVGWFIDDVNFDYATYRNYITRVTGDEGASFYQEWDADGWSLRTDNTFEIEDNTFQNTLETISIMNTGYGLVKNNYFDLSTVPTAGALKPLSIRDTGASVSGNDFQDPNNIADYGITSVLSMEYKASDIVWITGNTFGGLNSSGTIPIITSSGCVNIGYNYFMNCYSGIWVKHSVNSLVEHNDIDAIGGYGIEFTTGVGAVAEANNIKGAGLSGVMLHDFCDVELKDNNVTNAGKLDTPGDNHGIVVDTNRVINIISNEVNYSKGDGVHVKKDTNVRLTNVVSQFNDGSGLNIVDYSIPVVFQGNYSENKGYGIYMNNVNTSEQINKVEIYKNSLDGIHLKDTKTTIQHCKIIDNGGDGIDIQGGKDILIGDGNTIDYNDANGIFASETTGLMIENYGAAYVRNNKENGIQFHNTRGDIYGYYIALNAESGILIEVNQTGPTSSVSSPLVTIFNSTANYNVDYGLVTSYTGTSAGHQIYLEMNNNYLAFNGLLDVYAGTDTWVQWDVEFTSTVTNSNRRFDGNITVAQAQSLTLNSVDIVFLGQDNTITAEIDSYISLDNCHLTTTSQSFRFKAFSRVSITNSIIEKADSIYVSGSPYANFYGNKIYGGSNGIYLYKSSATIEKCEIYDCTYKALFISESSPTIRYSKIYNNDIGLYVLDTGAQAATLEDCEIYGNNYGGKFLAGIMDSLNTTWSQNSILDLSLTNFGGVGSYVYLLNSPADLEKVDVLDTQSVLETGWYLNVQVTNEALTPLFNASVELKDSLTHIDTYYTDEDGWVRMADRKEYRVVKSGIFDHLERETSIIAKIESGEGVTKQVTMNRTQTHYLIINIKPEISQTLPTINMTEDVPFYNVLDLNDYFSDNEELEFNAYGSDNLNVTIHPNGSIDIIPKQDWSGKENVTFSAKDSSGTTIWMEMPVGVQAVNDHPVIISIKLTPVLPVSKQKLSVEYSAADIDGGTVQEILKFIFWYKNGVRQDSYNYQSFVTETFKGEEWNCEMIVSDGIDQSPSYFSDVVTIQNSRPSIGDVIVNPSDAYTDTTLRSSVKEPYDVDDMNIDYLYQWQKKYSDAWMDIESAQTSTLDSSKFVKNDEIRLVVTPFDGTETGESVASYSIKIKNTPPSIEGVRITPEEPRRGAGFIRAYPIGVYDKDGDEVQYFYKWKLEGWPVPLSTEETLDSNVTVEMDALIYVFIEPYDADEWGESKNISFILKERDLDRDGIPDSDDEDIDGDGFNNTWEIIVGTDPEDASSKPEGGAAVDTDGDGKPDGDWNNSMLWMDKDDDGDGKPDHEDEFPTDSTEWSDWDKDGIGDNSDQDDDNDGYSDDMEEAVGTDPRDPGDYPEEDEAKAKESFWTNFFLFLIIILILVLCGVGVLYVYKQYIMEQPVEEKEDREEEDEFDRTGLLDYLKKGLGSLTAGVGAEDEDVSQDLSDIDLDADLVECSNCQAMIPADEDICPECEAHFLDEDEEEPVMGEPPDMDEELEDEDDEFSIASLWEDEEEEEEKPRKSKKGGKKKGKKKDKKKGKKKGKKKSKKKMKKKSKKRKRYDDDDDDDDDYFYDDDDEDEWF